MDASPLGMRMLALAILLLGTVAGFFAVSSYPAVPEALPVPRFLVRPFRLGLDLEGGAQLTWLADFSNFLGDSEAEAMDGLRDVIERRANLFGVAEPVVQVERSSGEWRLLVEVAGVDPARAIALIGETPFLEFRAPRSAADAEVLGRAQARGERLTEDAVFAATELTGRYLKRAEVEFDPTTNAPSISVEFTGEGADLFERLTAGHIGAPLGIYLDGALLSAPLVREAISGGRAQITGRFTLPEAKELVRRLNSGALPVPITLVGQRSVGASLGADSLARSAKAALAGVLAVALFMLVWYRLPGLVAVVALGVYVAIVLALVKLIPVTLTAAGIAGFVLSVGMAVDANILIFERTREELAAGRKLADAITEGFRRAWTSIRDSNVSSLITALILYWLGTSVVRGFAFTLGIGVLVSMFSAISVSRTFLLALPLAALARTRWLFGRGLGAL